MTTGGWILKRKLTKTFCSVMVAATISGAFAGSALAAPFGAGNLVILTAPGHFCDSNGTVDEAIVDTTSGFSFFCEGRGVDELNCSIYSSTNLTNGGCASLTGGMYKFFNSSSAPFMSGNARYLSISPTQLSFTTPLT